MRGLDRVAETNAVKGGGVRAKAGRAVFVGGAIAIAIAIGVVVLESGGSRSPSAGRTVPTSSTNPTTQTSSADQGISSAAGKVVFTGSAGCGSCHTLAAAGTTGTVGPNLGRRLRSDCDTAASKRIRGRTLQQCITTAITKPYAYLPHGYAAGIMPETYSQTLTATQIQALVNFLAGTPSSVTLDLTPTGPVYVCLVDGTGKKLIPGQIFSAGQKIPTETAPKLLVTLGNGSVRMKVNGRVVTVKPTASSIGFQLTIAGVSQLAARRQPKCA